MNGRLPGRTPRARGPARGAVVALAVALFVAFLPGSARAAAARDSARVPSGLGVPSAPVSIVAGTPMVGVNDLAALLGASRTWRADVRKLVLRAGEHRLTFTADNPFVLIDDRTVRLSADVVQVGGELHVPVELTRHLPAAAGWPQLAHDAEAHQLRMAPRGGFIRSPEVRVEGGVTRIGIATGRADAAAVVGRSRARFRVRMAGGWVGALPDSLPENGLVRDLGVSRAPDGVTFEIALDPATAGWRLEQDVEGESVKLTFARATDPTFEAFAPEGASGPRVLRTVVLDAGHGGDDLGVQTESIDEKYLTLELALRVARELERRGHVRVALTRRDDTALHQEARAEIANRERADAVISFHFGAYASPEAHGTLAWCPPATQATGAGAAARAAGLVALLPWREVALERAVESRGLAESLTAALERAGFGPSSVRERLPLALVGVQSPGVLLECGALTNPDERERLLSEAGMHALAIAIADGLLAWQRNE
jgi:N-acetylmuramoyl-L-alanine amidase